MSIGYIYILSNKAMPGLLKIGYTAKENVRERAQELSSSTGVPEPFQVEYYCLTRRVEEVERDTHKHFSPVRVEGKEFFRVSLRDAIGFIDSLVEAVTPDRYASVPALDETDESAQRQRWLQCRTCKHQWSIPFKSIDPPYPKCGWHISTRLKWAPQTPV